MNAENVIALADAIENRTLDGLTFSMRSYGISLSEEKLYGISLSEEKLRRRVLALNKRDQKHACHTAACMAGHCVVLSGSMSMSEFRDFTRSNTAIKIGKTAHTIGREWLGLSKAEADYLFATYVTASDDESVAVLRHAASSGLLDWRVANPNYGTMP